MYARRGGPVNNRLPSPFPEGWYFVTSRAALMKSRLIQKTWMGENIVAWCDEQGSICVAEAYCPHLGSHLGPETGGRIRDGKLICPFHGYEFSATGQCVATPYADPPRNTGLRVFETEEICGLVFAWWGINGRPPQWKLHPDRPEQAGWSRQEIRTLRFPGHPQETTENSVDMAHFRYVHGYGSVNRVGRVLVDGPRLESRFDFRTVRKIARFGRFTMDVAAVTQVFGLGYSFVEVRERTIVLDMRMWVLATPVDGTNIDLSLVSQVREIRSPQRRIAGLGFLPVGWRAPLLNRFMAAMQQQDVLQDEIIWRNKMYRSRPRLCRSDGEIMPYRAYCAQFYPDPNRSESPAGATPDRSAVQGTST